MENKKPKALVMLLATAMLTGVLTVGLAGTNAFEKGFLGITANKDTMYTQTFDAGNAPTDSLEFLDTAQIRWGAASYTYTDVKGATGAHCVLDAGGTITKNEEALGLYVATVVFEGDLDLVTSFDLAGETTTYDLVSGTEQYLCGNYLTFVANTETTITSITLTYTCTHSVDNDHNYVRTDRFATNGDDLDYVLECSKCHAETTEVNFDGFNTYRMGEMIAPVAGKGTITKAATAIGGVEDAYHVVGNTLGAADDYNYKVEPLLVSHTLGTAKSRQNIKDYEIAAISFDIYATEATANFRIGSPALSVNKTANTWTFDFQGKYNYSNSLNGHVRIFNIDGTFPDTLAVNKWYTVVVDYPDLTNYPENQYHCVEICNIKGDFYYSNVRYWHEVPHALDNLTLEWVINTTNPPLGTYTDGSIGGKDNVKIFTGANTWRDQLDFSFTNKTAASGKGSFKDNFYLVKYNGIKEFKVDIYLPAGTSIRLQTNHCDSNNANAQKTNLLAAGSVYNEHQAGKENTHVTVTYQTESGVQTLNIGDVAPADTWFTVTFDVSFWQSMKYNGSSYTNVSLIAPNGSVGITNISYSRNYTL